MKTTVLFRLFVLSVCILVGQADARSQKSRPSTKSKTARSTQLKANVTAKSSRAKAPISTAGMRALSEALAMVRAGQCEKAVSPLFVMSKKSEFAGERMQIKYLLGTCLMELKMYQVAAFQFVDVIRKGGSKYVKQAIEKLTFAADALGDDTMLNYAISKVQLENFPAQNRDIIYYRLGEIKMKNNKFGEAADLFSKVAGGSRYHSQSQFNRGLAFLEANRTSDAMRIFKDLLASRATSPVNDTNRVAAELAIARTYYQAQDWENAIEAYRAVPRDNEAWHDSLFESSWAMLRAAKFRSALSNFQSLHSTYYEDFYLPESLLLRAIVYLYICKYDEMDKVLVLFEKTYGPIRSSLGQFMLANKDSVSYYNELERASNHRQDKKMAGSLKIPYSVARSILDEGDVKRSLSYMKMLAAEKSKIDSMPKVARSSFGLYANKILANRAKNTKIAIGDMVKVHLIGVRTELKDLFEQAGFIRYEMINGRKETLKKKIAGKALEQVDEQVDRTFFVQNGYEYWPFEGEYWLDEIGNYHYLGKQSCE
jgi:tetratricopeptide (TPR) repeat protein